MKRKEEDFVNDLGKRLVIRFKKSKDFQKTIEKLQKEGFTTRLKAKLIQKKLKDKKNNTYIYNSTYILYYLKVYKDNKEVLYMLFTLRDRTDKYKQYIEAIYY